MSGSSDLPIANTVKDSSSSYKIHYVIVIKNYKNTEGHQNRITGSKVTAILLKGWIFPIGGVASGRVCACSLRSRLVYKKPLNVVLWPKRPNNLGSSSTQKLEEKAKQILPWTSGNWYKRHNKCGIVQDVTFLPWKNKFASLFKCDSCSNILFFYVFDIFNLRNMSN